jgi:CRISPR-associated protein Cas6
VRAVAAAAGTTVDVAFHVSGQALPRDHAQALQQAVCDRWPWMSTDVLAGIHPVKLVHGTDETALLSRRSRLLFRIATHRVNELQGVSGFDLNVQGHFLKLGSAHRHELLPHGTLYAYRVAASSPDEIAFMDTVKQELEELAIGGDRVCGKRQSMVISEGRVLTTFSLMLHGLSQAQSLQLQQHGLGPHRLLGCGIFVPHKSAAAV